MYPRVPSRRLPPQRAVHPRQHTHRLTARLSVTPRARRASPLQGVTKAKSSARIAAPQTGPVLREQTGKTVAVERSMLPYNAR